MARMKVFLDGTTEANGTPLLMNNPRAIDRLDPFTRSVAEISNKRNKTEADELELSHRQFLCGIYHNDELGPYMPVWNIVRCIQDAGKQHKLGKSVLRAVVPAMANAAVQYDGPRDIDELWKDGRFAYRNPVGIGQSRVMKTRPIFVDWKIEAEIEVDLTQISPDKIEQLIAEAGRYQALGDYRPTHGRFLGSAVLVDPDAAMKELEKAA
jgi:hypothetical protein